MSEKLSGGFERRFITEHTVDLSQGPVDFMLHESAMQIVNPARDLQLECPADYLVINPTEFEPGVASGYAVLPEGRPVELGRVISPQFKLPNGVSRRHASVKRQGSEAVIRDLGSTNGTFITAKTEEAIERDDLAAIDIAGESRGKEHTGRRNQDSYFVDAGRLAIGVFDGVATAVNGGQASRLAAETIQEYLANIPRSAPRQLGRAAMLEAFNVAHKAIVKEVGVGSTTTATVAAVFESKETPYLVIGSVGDSRAYRLRDKELSHLTLDQAYGIHRLTGDAAAALQKTLATIVSPRQLTGDLLEIFQKRNLITGSLGSGDDPEVIVSEADILPDDLILLTSDGIHDNLTHKQIERTARAADSAETIVETLVNQAQKTSRDLRIFRAKADDMTAAVMKF